MSIFRLCNFSRLNYLLVLILAFPLVGCSGGDGSARASVAALSWVAPSEREDGSVLSLSEIAGYRIYYGVESGNYQGQIDVNDGSAVQAQISGISLGKYFVALTTVDTEGRESSFSTEVVVVL